MQKHEPEEDEMLEIGCFVVKYNPYSPDDVERIDEMVEEQTWLDSRETDETKSST